MRRIRGVACVAEARAEGAVALRSTAFSMRRRGSQVGLSVGRIEVGPICGCSSMVEQKPSKLMTRVRFPSPAPIQACKIMDAWRVDISASLSFLETSFLPCLPFGPWT
jgi:hypothetical protein